LLSGGCVAELLCIDLDDGRSVVAKCDASGHLDVEAWMLRTLAATETVPVPAVLYSEPDLLVLEYVETDDGGLDAGVQRHAADLMAALHGVRGGYFGLERDTLIGGLVQPNPPTSSWVAFLRDHRLMAMGRRACESGTLSTTALRRLERLCERLGEWIEEPDTPRLIHGDLWGGNVLVRDGRVAALVDPAIYYADPEIELAFSTLFSTFGASFFDRYSELRPIRAGFFEARRDLYNLYPLLVHTVLFGTSYAASVDATVTRFVGR